MHYTQIFISIYIYINDLLYRNIYLQVILFLDPPRGKSYRYLKQVSKFLLFCKNKFQKLLLPYLKRKEFVFDIHNPVPLCELIVGTKFVFFSKCSFISLRGLI